MPQTAFCYHCHSYHPIEAMRQVETKGGGRWRCIKSIEAVKQKTLEEREALGRQVTAINKADQQAMNRRAVRPERTRD